MKISLFVLLFLLFSCSTQSLDNSRTIASGRPARIIKLISGDGIKLTRGSSKQELIKVQLFEFGKKMAADRTVSFKVVEGNVSLEKRETQSDNNGVAQTLIKALDSVGRVVIRIKADNVFKTLELNITKPAFYSGKFSYSKSEVTISNSSVPANGNGKIEINTTIRNSSGNQIKDAYGLKVKIRNNLGEEFDMVDLDDGSYRFIYPIGKSSKKLEFNAFIGDKQLGSLVSCNLTPVLRGQSVRIKSELQKNGSYKISFTLLDMSGRVISPANINLLKLSPLTNRVGSASGIESDIISGRYFFNYSAPTDKKGSIKVGLSVNGKSYFIKNEILYEAVLVDYQKSYISLSKEQKPATGVDSIKLYIHLNDKNGKVVKELGSLGKPQIELIGAGEVHGLTANEKGLFSAKIVANNNTTELKVIVRLGNKIIGEKEITYDFKAKRERVLGKRYTVSSMVYHQGLTYVMVEREKHAAGEGRSVSFSFDNEGVNDVIPRGAAPDEEDEVQCSRQFKFKFLDHATQNSYMEVTDMPNGFVSHMMLSNFHFFPRLVLPSFKVLENEGKIEVTLPTTEKVYFDLEMKNIVGGVLEEGQIDLGPSRFSRKFATIRYKGKGIVLRANGRGQMPQLGEFNKKTISGDFGNNGGASVMIYRYDEETDDIVKCIRPKLDFWEAKDSNPIKFKFENDTKLNKYLLQHCNLQIPKILEN